MAAKYIIAALSILFLSLAAVRIVGSGRGPSHPQVKVWLIVGGIFGVVAAYLFLQQP